MPINDGFIVNGHFQATMSETDASLAEKILGDIDGILSSSVFLEEEASKN